jgi:hypothetical protein
MGFFRRAADKLSPARGRAKAGSSVRVDDGVATHLAEFVRTRRGVEAYVEPQTIVTQTTILLVAWDGEWTRRRVPSPQWAYAFAEHHQIPGYDALVIGYPQRMRDYNSRLTRRLGDGRRAPSSSGGGDGGGVGEVGGVRRPPPESTEPGSPGSGPAGSGPPEPEWPRMP